MFRKRQPAIGACIGFSEQNVQYVCCRKLESRNCLHFFVCRIVLTPIVGHHKWPKIGACWKRKASRNATEKLKQLNIVMVWVVFQEMATFLNIGISPFSPQTAAQDQSLPEKTFTKAFSHLFRALRRPLWGARIGPIVPGFLGFLKVSADDSVAAGGGA